MERTYRFKFDSIPTKNEKKIYSHFKGYLNEGTGMKIVAFIKGEVRINVDGISNERIATVKDLHAPKHLWGKTFLDLYYKTVDSLTSAFVVKQIVLSNEIYSDFLAMKCQDGDLDINDSDSKDGASFGEWLRAQQRSF